MEHPHERDDLISILHPPNAFQHRVSGDQIIRPHTVNGDDGGLMVRIDVSDALTPCFGCEDVLEGSCGLFDFLGDLLRNSSRD